MNAVNPVREKRPRAAPQPMREKSACLVQFEPPLYNSGGTETSMARLVVKNGVARGKEFSLVDTQTIGRLAKNEIPIEDSRMSRANSRVYRLGVRWLIEDLSSKNGTYLNSARIEKAVLSEGDEIRIGETYFDFVLDAADRADADAVTAGAIKADGMGVSDRHLSFSRYAGEDATKTSFLWIRQDLGQREGSFRYLIYAGVLLFAVGLFFLVQMLITGH